MFCNSCNNSWLWILIILILLFSCGGSYGGGWNNGCCEHNGCGCGCN